MYLPPEVLTFLLASAFLSACVFFATRGELDRRNGWYDVPFWACTLAVAFGAFSGVAILGQIVKDANGILTFGTFGLFVLIMTAIMAVYWFATIAHIIDVKVLHPVGI